MSAPGPRTPAEHPRREAAEPPQMSVAEKIACEWEARHDVSSRGRQVDPAAALRRYLTHAHVEEELGHRDRSARGPAHPRTEQQDDFAAQHPLTASWLRWGEDRR